MRALQPGVTRFERALHQAASTPAAPTLLSAFVFLSRIPFVWYGYGADPDAWTVVRAARHLARTGIYIPSRLPGYPLPEFTGALLVLLGVDNPVSFNLLSAFWAAAGAAAAFRLARPLGPTRALLFSGMVSFTPASFVGSIGAMDYPWGFALFLASAVACQSARFVVSGVLLGLAVASRPTYALAGISLAVLALHADFSLASLRRGWRAIAKIALSSVAVAVLFHLPTLLMRRAELGIMPREFSPVVVAFNMSAGLLGLLGAPVVFAAVAFGVRNATRKRSALLEAQPVRQLVVFGGITTALYLLLFLRLPDEAAYLIPALLGPYLFVIATVPPVGSALVTLSLAVACFIGSISRDDGGPTAGKVRLHLAGPVLQTVDTQMRVDCIARVVEELIERQPDRTVVIAGDLSSHLIERLGSARAHNIFYYITHDATGRQITERSDEQLAPDSQFYIVDRAIKTLDLERRDPGKPTTNIDTQQACPDG